ncbi:hypothetical protein, partial [Paraburkholderia domus]|uniref:hypothetical protein n=1 Tax=Paraburkholderia domus TaxID=2793075 RepID=UPI001B8B76A4
TQHVFPHRFSPATKARVNALSSGFTTVPPPSVTFRAIAVVRHECFVIPQTFPIRSVSVFS